jgi:hypothetical protein
LRSRIRPSCEASAEQLHGADPLEMTVGAADAALEDAVGRNAEVRRLAQNRAARADDEVNALQQ